MDNDLERKIEEINIRLRLGKLDSLLLLIPTLLGIAFSLSQYYLRIVEEEAIIAVFIPILIVNVGIPVYIGYYRGAISLDSIVERARGWIYLADGFLICAYLTVVMSLGGAIQTPAIYHPESVIYLLLFPLGGFAVGFIDARMAQRIGSKILSLMQVKSSKQDERAFEYTGMSAFFIAGFTVFLVFFSKMINGLQKLVPEGFSYVRSIDLWYFPSTTDELKLLTYLRFSVIVLTFVFFLFLLSEKLARGHTIEEPIFYGCIILDLILPLTLYGFATSVDFLHFSHILLIFGIVSGTAGILLALISPKKLTKIDHRKATITAK